MAVRNNEVRYELVAETGGEIPSEPPLRLLRRALRGRYSLVVILSASLAIAGAIVGFNAAPPTFESTGLVQVKGAIAPILYESQENRLPPNFDAYVASQVTLLQNQQVLEAAASMPQMQGCGWPSGLPGVARLEGALTIRRGRGEQIISVSITDHDPQRAQTAVDAVLTAFEENCRQPGGLPLTAKTDALIQRQQTLEEDLLQLHRRIMDASDQYGISAIERMHTNKVEELMAIDSRLAEFQLARTDLGLGNLDDNQGWVDSTSSQGGGTKTAQLEEREMALQAEIASRQANYGPNSPMIRELNRQLEAVRIQLDLHRRSLSDLATTGHYNSIDQSAVAAASGERLDELETRYDAIRDRVRAETAALAEKRVLLTRLNDQVTETKERLAVTRQRLDELRVEARGNSANRISIAARGDLPIVPISDRQQGLTAAGAIFGAILGVAIVFCIGISDPRIRYTEALEALNLSTPLIGLLPDLNVAGGERKNLATRSVHQLRNLLEMQCRNPNENVHAITSCRRGEGKTSLTLGLGASFAAAGRKTLVIDADITRCSLTRELGLTDVQGLCETIGPDSNNAQVHRTQQENLWALPIGSARGLDPEDLSRDRLTWLLDALRNRFDSIIIDTGPVLSSVEASLVTAVADRAIMVVHRDQKAELIRASLSRLDQLGASCSGIVFNKAPATDIRNREATTGAASTQITRFVPAALKRDGQPVASPTGQIKPSTETTQVRKRAA